MKCATEWGAFHGQVLQDMISNPHIHSVDRDDYPHFSDGETEAPWGAMTPLSSYRQVSDGAGICLCCGHYALQPACTVVGCSFPGPLWVSGPGLWSCGGRVREEAWKTATLEKHLVVAWGSLMGSRVSSQKQELFGG